EPDSIFCLLKLPEKPWDILRESSRIKNKQDGTCRSWIGRESVVRIRCVPEILISADKLVDRLLEISRDTRVCILDSCGVGYLDSHLLIAGIDPFETTEFAHGEITALDKLIDAIESDLPCIFTLSYELGMALAGVQSRHPVSDEPYVFLARFQTLIV